MNPALYLSSVAITAAGLALAAWRWPLGLRLPALSRLALGLAATPFALSIVTLSLTLVWPLAPRPVILAAPGLLVMVGALLLYTQTRTTLRAASRRWHRRPIMAPEAIIGAVLILATASWHLGRNALQPVSAHDALIYLNEARTFALIPRWSTYLDMVNPITPDGLVTGHTHTWLYSTYLAQALLATHGPAIGADHDLIARLAGQTNLLLLILAVMGLTWAVTRRHALLTLSAGVAAACIPYVGYITANSSIDAFRILPLVLLVSLLIGGLRRTGSWIIAAVLLGVSMAAHTLNLGVAPLLVGARLTAGLRATQWRSCRRVFLPAALACLIPVVGFYANLWRETGRPLGLGLHYPFYAGTVLETISQRGILSQVKPTLTEVWLTLEKNYDVWILIVPWLALTGNVLLRSNTHRRFFSILFIACWLVLLSGALPGVPSGVTRVFLGNARYALPFWFLAIPMVACVARALPLGFLRPPTSIRRPLALLATACLVGGAWQGMATRWPIPYSTNEEIAAGERRIATEVARTLQPGETWMTDRNTAAYYVMRPGIFLYTPAGRAWLKAETSAEAWVLLCRYRVRLVALSNLDPAWWPAHPLYAALNEPGHAEITTLHRWRIYLLKLPDPGSSPVTP
jgi:hypothetical protein